MNLKRTIAIMFAGLMLIGLPACEKEGPAEKAGKMIDDAASDVADSAKDVEKSVEKKLEEK